LQDQAGALAEVVGGFKLERAQIAAQTKRVIDITPQTQMLRRAAA
jgi:methyl-accepting chemotaxis protein